MDDVEPGTDWVSYPPESLAGRKPWPLEMGRPCRGLRKGRRLARPRGGLRGGRERKRPAQTPARRRGTVRTPVQFTGPVRRHLPADQDHDRPLRRTAAAGRRANDVVLDWFSDRTP